jgi:aminopeptidase N
MQKHLGLYIAFITSVLVSISSYSQVNTYNLIENEKRHFEGFLLKNQSNVGQNIDVKYHRFNWDINPHVYYIKGNVTTYFTSKTASLSQITLDFNETLVIDSIIAHNTHLDHNVEGYVLTIELENSLSLNAIDSLTIYYQGEPPDDAGFGSFDQFVHDDGPIIWTLSEPYGAKDWWPCKQDLNDKIDSIDIIVNSPQQFRAASNGVLIRDEVIDTTRISHWKHRHPIAAYLIAIAVTNYDVYNDEVELVSGDKVSLVNYVYPGYEDDMENRMSELKQMIKFFSDKFIDYPFKDEKYGHAQFGWSGGMEHQTMSFMGNLGYYLTAHELAHQWFGDYITCGSWAEIWLNEGFARYCEHLVMEEFTPEGAPEWRHGKIGYITAVPDGSVYVDDTTSVSRIFSRRLTYEKAGMVLHMIRKEIGDDAFFQAIKNYLTDPEIQNGYASTEQLRNHFENSADTNLVEFFNDWIYGEGNPNYNINWNQSIDGIVDITIKQSQSNLSVDFFENKIEFQLKGDLADTTFIVHNTENNQEIFINPGFEATELLFDPHHHIIAGTPTINPVLNLSLEDKFKLIPNPANDFINIRNKSNLYIQSITVINISGKIMIRKDIKSSESEYQFNIQNFPQGTYFFKIESVDQNYLYKFIKKD